MADYFFDTSALVKRHVIETGYSWVRSMTHAKSGHTIYIARITAVEMVAAITRRQRGGSLSSAQAGAILGHFRRHLAGRYFVLEMNPPLLTSAMLLARLHGLRAYDAVQLATVLEFNRSNQEAGFGSVTLVSADRELNTAATTEGLTIDDPNSHT
jgi:uncharacterized protein